MRRRVGTAPKQLATLFHGGVIAELNDGQLLDRFATRCREEAEPAFAILVERHEAMVLRVCRRILSDPDDAQDAAQATFLVLALKAGSIRHRSSIGGWLHGVADRVARCSKASVARRRRHESAYALMAGPPWVEEAGDDEAAGILHEELGRLPGRHRLAVMLCDLEGLTHEEAASLQGCPVGTIKSRLARGRRRLAERLRRRGIALGAGLVRPAAGWVGRPWNFIESTTAVAMRAASAGPASGAIPAAVASLASGAIRMMRVELLKRGVQSLILGTALAASAVAVARMQPAAPSQSTAAGGTAPARGAGPEGPLPPPGPRAFHYEIAFIDSPGLLLHRLGLRPDVGGEPPVRYVFLSDVEVDVLNRQLENAPAAVVAHVPKVSGDDKVRTLIRIPDDFHKPAALNQSPDLGKPDAAAGAEAIGRAAEGGANRGCELRLTSQLSADARYRTLNVAIRNLHVVAMHKAEVPELGPRPQGGEEVPELVRTDVDQKITLPAASGAVLINLGIMRTVDAAGASSIAERLVMIRVRPDPAPGTPAIRKG
ncbi:RNA polymerase sigma factor [Aquisphaera insulae]|uniref:RNA polymerase sigma factor n=1 Tax=Aquisphaera insulae TaxID=2712864 RepID=UPI0013EB267C|nr:RNA polymerase sigma factor [Aquisphaera insulae]